MVCIEVDIVTGKSFISKLKSKHKGNAELFPYDTGEQVAGFRSREDGSFVGVMVIQSEKDLENFKRLYRVDDVRKIY